MPLIERKCKPVNVKIDIDGNNVRFLSFEGDNHTGDITILRPYWDDDSPVYIYASNYQRISNQLRALADILEGLANA